MPLAAQLQEGIGDRARLARTREQVQRLRALLNQPAAGTAADWLGRQLERTGQ